MTMLRKKMLTIVTAAAVLTGLSVAAYAADAIDAFPFRPKATTLSTADQGFIMKATHEVLEKRAVGANVNWSNAKTRATGTVKVIRVFEEAGRPCGEVDQTYLAAAASPGAAPRHFVLEYCRLSTGLWKLSL